MTVQNPLDLPEILSCIGEFLRPQDRIHCLRVCKTWYRTLLPQAWRTICLPPMSGVSMQISPRLKDSSPSMELLERHGPFVRTLETTYRNNMHNSKHQYFSNLTSLRTLKLWMTDNDNADRLDARSNSSTHLPLHSHSQSYPHLPSQKTMILIMANNYDLLTTLKVNTAAYGRRLPKGFLNALTNLRALKYLTLSNIMMTREHVEDLRRLCCIRLESLALMEVLIVPNKSNNHNSNDNGTSSNSTVALHPFPYLREIGMYHVEGFDGQEQFDLIHHCPLLESLSWYSSQLEMTEVSVLLAKQVLTGTWPFLKKLSIHLNGMSDSTLAMILSGLGERTAKLNLAGTGFGPLSFSKLQPAQALSVLKLQDCVHLTSEMQRKILCSCPGLRVFIGEAIVAKEVVIHEDRPWACQLIETLDVRFLFGGGHDEGCNNDGSEEDDDKEEAEEKLCHKESRVSSKKKRMSSQDIWNAIQARLSELKYLKR
ncbi:hypothetical protein BCR41DRAFT_110344 [Lobosporangium transversale]|uniref:F-box domain-containing protein n=1 Tax=Lobosporangium transversale TaxID=64571 RepID=A0A1Y2GHU4_9FUNG|nr:hypothetical protein BCR41DRAFT_110344 [Lobosporangium transversale]ORZ11276.1 hypothetical protein BCR41DRAFT_110344 [Lobosporangium transversale]|eukprot:XP_021879591.1 hypothetical protein BCR41DRAFT_110344 [Lobosporangium transversale]